MKTSSRSTSRVVEPLRGTSRFITVIQGALARPWAGELNRFVVLSRFCSSGENQYREAVELSSPASRACEQTLGSRGNYEPKP